MTTGPGEPPDLAAEQAEQAAQAELLRFFGERLLRPVSLDLWTRHHTDLIVPDRDPCEHCEDQLALIRQFVRLSPLLSVTLYDLDRHAARAQQLGVDLAPATFIRSGRSQVQYVGMASGTLLAAFMDAMSYVSVGRTPLDDASREVLAALERPVHVEILGAPYDAVSGHLMRLTAAMAAECRHVRPRIVDATEYPLFAARRQVTGVPVIVIEGQRFAGLWEEADLVEQIRRAAAGETEPVAAEPLYALPFITEAAARAGEPPAAPPTTPGGLYIPGRD